VIAKRRGYGGNYTDFVNYTMAGAQHEEIKKVPDSSNDR
jgi:hypothetical protein